MSVEAEQPSAPTPVAAAGQPVPEAASAPESTFRPDVEGFRAVAVGLVVLFHAGIATVSGGYIGVDVFYVISGLLITGLLLRDIERSGTVSLRRFYARRVRRLLPLSSLVLAATAAVGLAVIAPVDRGVIGRDIASAALYVSNWRFASLATDYMAADIQKSPVQQYWSLSLEEQFYVVWPLLLILLASRRGLLARLGLPLRARVALPLAVIGVGSLALSILTTTSSGPTAYFGLHTRAWELAAGAGLAVAAPWLPRMGGRVALALGWAGLALVVYAGLAFDEATPFPGSAAIVPVLGSVLVLAAGFRLPQGGAGRVLGNRAFRYVGRISYAWYLWHWPCIVYAKLIVGGDDPSAYVARRWLLLAVVVSFALAAASHVLVENPARYSRALSLRASRSLAAGVVLTAVGAGAGAALAGLGSSGGAIAGGMTPEAARADTVGSLKKCHLGYRGVVPKVCVYGAPNGRFTVAIIGDSHAAHWEPALDRLGKARGWKVILMTKSGCPWVEISHFDPGSHRIYPECATWRANLWKQLRADPVDLLLIARIGAYQSRVVKDGVRLTSWGPESAALWEQGARESLAAIGSSAKRIVILRDIPRPPSDVPGCLSEHTKDPQACAFLLTPRSLHPDAGLAEAEARAGGDRVSFADLTGVVCPGGLGTRCPVVTKDGVIKYRDDHHMTITYARSLAFALEKAIAKARPYAVAGTGGEPAAQAPASTAP